MQRTKLAWRSGRSFVASYGSIVIARWAGAPTAAQLRILAEHCAEVAEATGGAGLLNLVTAGTTTFDDEARLEALALSRREAIGNLGVAHAVLVPGLTGVLIRSILLAIVALTGPRAPTETFNDLEAAAAWLANHTGVKPLDLVRATADLLEERAGVHDERESQGQ